LAAASVERNADKGQAMILDVASTHARQAE
jgi:hypothetical protein